MIVEFVLAAELELDEAVAYYDARQPGLGNEFAREVQTAVERIEEFPYAWRRLAGDVRRCPVRRFPYGLVYRVRGEVATVYAVMRLRRRPSYWRNRLKQR